jgi:hypothetical protein
MAIDPALTKPQKPCPAYQPLRHDQSLYGVQVCDTPMDCQWEIIKNDFPQFLNGMTPFILRILVTNGL